MDDRNPTHRIGILPSGRDQHHVYAAEKIWKRYHDRDPFHCQVLLPFQGVADQSAISFFQESRIRWTLEDLAEFEDELESENWRTQNQDTLEKFRNLADPRNVPIDVVDDEQKDKFVIRLESPEVVGDGQEVNNREYSRINSLRELAH